MYYAPRDKIVLKELSANSRITVSGLAKAAQCSRVTALKLIGKLISQLDIRFTIEIDMEKLGLSERYLVAVRFKTRPSDEELSRLFKDDKYVQCVLKINGKFDLLIYAVADNAINYTKWETLTAEALSQYGATIMPSRYVVSHFGYLPMNDSFIELIGDQQRLDRADKLMLKTLNGYSRASYGELGKMSGISEATARYRLFRLIKKGIISRFTIAVQAPPENYASMIYFINYTFTKTTSSVAFSSARDSYFSDDKDSPLLNTFQLIFPISGSFRSFGMVLCETKKIAFEKAVVRHRKIFRNENARILSGEVIKPIKGLLPFRNLDIRSNYKIINWHGHGM